jgi:hypothetical protein
LRERSFDHRPALSVVRHICSTSGGITTLPRDHLDRTSSKLELPIRHQNTHPGAREQHCSGSAVADAISRGTAAGNDGDLALQAEVTSKF